MLDWGGVHKISQKKHHAGHAGHAGLFIPEGTIFLELLGETFLPHVDNMVQFWTAWTPVFIPHLLGNVLGTSLLASSGQF